MLSCSTKAIPKQSPWIRPQITLSGLWSPDRTFCSMRCCWEQQGQVDLLGGASHSMSRGVCWGAGCVRMAQCDRSGLRDISRSRILVIWVMEAKCREHLGHSCILRRKFGHFGPSSDISGERKHYYHLQQWEEASLELILRSLARCSRSGKGFLYSNAFIFLKVMWLRRVLCL